MSLKGVMFLKEVVPHFIGKMSIICRSFARWIKTWNF